MSIMKQQFIAFIIAANRILDNDYKHFLL